MNTVIDTIMASKEIANNINAEEVSSNNYWMWIAIIEFFVVLILIFQKNKKGTSQKERFKKEAKKGNIDFDNIINSSFNAKKLFDDLKKKCHPDRFPNDEVKNKIALELFQQISKNRTNYKKLLELKEDVKQKLNINF